MRRTISNTVRELSRTLAELFNDYRPELHYMRGPGPKCSAKRAEPSAPRPMAANAEATRRATERARA